MFIYSNEMILCRHWSVASNLKFRKQFERNCCGNWKADAVLVCFQRQRWKEKSKKTLNEKDKGKLKGARKLFCMFFKRFPKRRMWDPPCNMPLSSVEKNASIFWSNFSSKLYQEFGCFESLKVIKFLNLNYRQLYKKTNKNKLSQRQVIKNS